MIEALLPSPVQEVHYQPVTDLGIGLFVKRDDLIHPEVSGNKWRKLKLNLEKALSLGHRTLLTFGGAHSNHLVATAAAGRAAGIGTIGVVRGEDADMGNPTLSRCKALGMHLHTVSREEYRRQDEWAYVKSLEHHFGAFYAIPQGGANFLGVQGCSEIMSELEQAYHRIYVACGTGTTLSGMAMANAAGSLLAGVQVLRGDGIMERSLRTNLASVYADPELEDDLCSRVLIDTDHHCGGYARTTPELITLMRSFYRDTGIKLDPVYTAKAFSALCTHAAQQPEGIEERWLLLHTGGLQGIPAMEARLGTAIYPDC